MKGYDGLKTAAGRACSKRLNLIGMKHCYDSTAEWLGPFHGLGPYGYICMITSAKAGTKQPRPEEEISVSARGVPKTGL